MVVRKRRKKNKLRGQRYHGGGNTKNRRGAGNRGGVGKAGSHKHKFSKHYVDFGVSIVLKAKPKGEAVNLEYISEKLAEWTAIGKAKKEDGMIVIDGKEIGIVKILGKGNIKEKISVVNCSVSKTAGKKIVSAGGKAGDIEAEDDEFETEETEGEMGEEE